MRVFPFLSRIIGQAAFTGKHQWMFASTYCGEWGPTLFIDNQDGFQVFHDI